MDLHDAGTGGFPGKGELDFAVKATATEEGRVQDVDAVCGGDDLGSEEGEEGLARAARIQAGLLLLTLMRESDEKPSSWLRSSSIVLCTSRSPDLSESKRFVPMASISSMKMMAGA